MRLRRSRRPLARAVHVGRVLWVSAALGASFLALGLDSACSSTASLVAAGGACELATDCAEGLVCIPDTTSATGRSCSSDLASIQETELPDAAGDATVEEDGGDGSVTTYPTGDDGSTSQPDATGTTDAGGGAPPQDSGTTPVKDSGPAPTPDAGPADSGGD